ncbi:MAG: RluA family pseudouridine synthase [Sphingomonadales bacterium]
MSGVQIKTVSAEDVGIRLDKWFLKYFPTLSHGKLSKLLRKGEVRLGGKRAKAGERIAIGDEIRIPPLGDLPTEKNKKPKVVEISDADREMLQAMVIYKNHDVIALNKVPGLAVQGGTNTHRHIDGMLDALKFEASGRPKLVHRLDKDTSGVLLLARNRQSAKSLTGAFKERQTEKIYWALVMGVPQLKKGKIDQPMEKISLGMGNERMVASEGGKKAVTFYSVVETASKKASWVALKPITGRTHQLRLHMVLLGHPIVGDGKYGAQHAMLTGQISRKLHLHARSISIPDEAGVMMNITADLPQHMLESWDTLGFDIDTDENPFEGLD